MNPTLSDDKTEGGTLKPCDFVYKGKIADPLDWREIGKTSKVRNQKKCGSCYIFAALSVLESAYLLNSETKNMELSAQALLNCVPNGCGGGMGYIVWTYIMKNGAPKESLFPYKAEVCLEIRIEVN